MRSREDLYEHLQAIKPDLAERYGVARIGMFGSVARSEQTEASDLDLLVSFEEPVSLFDVIRLEQELESKLGVAVDIVTEGSLKPRIGDRVTDDLIEV